MVNTAIRKLGYFESSAALIQDFSPYYATSILRLMNGPPPDIVQQALNLLQLQQPLLKVTLQKQKNDYYFYQAPPPYNFPVEVIDRQSDIQWHTVVETEMMQNISLHAAPLARCIYLYSSDKQVQSELIFIFHHIIFDGASAEKFLDSLLTLCATLWANKPPPLLTPLSVMPPVEDLFPPTHQNLNRLWKSLSLLLRLGPNELRYRRQGIDRQEILEDKTAVQGQFITIRLPRDTTTALVKRTRQNRVTINAALNAAILQTTLKHNYSQANLWLRGVTFTNLRPHLHPALSSDYLGAYFTLMPYDIYLTANSDYWSLASKLNDIFYKITKYGDKFTFTILTKYMARLLLGAKKMQFCSIANSYVGPMNLKPTYGPIQVQMLHGFTVNNVLGPKVAVSSRILFGELVCDIFYLTSNMNREQTHKIGDDICQILNTVSEQ